MAIAAKLKNLPDIHVKVRVDEPDVTKAKTDLQAKMSAGPKPEVKVNVKADDSSVLSMFAKLRAEISTFGPELSKRIIVSGKGVADATEAFAKLRGELGTFGPELQKFTIFNNDAGVATKALTAELDRQAAAQRALRDSWDAAYQETLRQEAGATAAAGAINYLGGRWGWLNAQVSLFGGRAAVAGWHLALDGVIEALAVIVPAVVTAAAGLAAFGAAGYDAAVMIENRMKNVHTIFDATGGVIKPMTANLEKLHDQVRPMVWQLYGDAITVAGNKTGIFNSLATQTGGVIDRMAARLTAMLTSGGGGLKTFLDAGKQDLAVFGQIFSNLGSAFAKLIQVTQKTHIADFLLEGLNVASKLLELVTKLPIPLLAVVAGLHGLYIWGGLAWSWIEKLGTAMMDLAKAGLIERALTALTKIPLAGWAGIGAVAIAGLVLWFSHGQDATEKWISSLNKMVSNSTAFTAVTNVTNALAQTTTRLAAANQQFAVQQDKATVAMHGAVGATGGIHEAYTQAGGDVRALTGEQQNLISQFGHLTTFLGGVAGTYKTDLVGAMQLAAVAQVNVNKVMQGSAADVQAARIQVDSLVTGYKNMGQQGGALGADLKVLTISESDQLKAVQTLNSAYDQWTKNLAAPRDTFIAFARSIVMWGNDAQSAGASMTGLSGAAIAMSKKVSTASLNVQADFQSSFAAANQLFDALRTSGAPANTFNSVVRELVATLIPMTGGSKAATAEVSALAQEAGGPATTNVKVLQDWVGRSVKPMTAMQKATNQVTIASSNLSLTAQKLSATLQNDLNAMMAQTILKTSGVQGAMEKYTRDLQNNTANTAAGRQHRAELIADFEKAGLNASQARTQVDSLTKQIGGLHGKNVNIGVSGTGQWHVVGATGSVPGRGVVGPPLTTRREGGLIPGFGGGDIIPLLAEPGETVVSKEHTQLLAHVFKSLGIKGFQGGGVVGSFHDGAAAEGRWAAGEYNATVTALEKAVAGAAFKGSGFSAGMPGSVPSGPIQQMARALLAAMGWAGEWNAFNSLVMAESGWNPYATNASSGAYGIPQSLPGSKMASAGADWRTNPQTQLRWMMGYIANRYGDPAGAWAHETAYHWYRDGTGGAAPGWAWVGENGPELVRMKGGEEVLDAATSAMAGIDAHGYASGTPQPGEFCAVHERGKTSHGLTCRLARDGRYRWESPGSPRSTATTHGRGASATTTITTYPAGYASTPRATAAEGRVLANRFTLGDPDTLSQVTSAVKSLETEIARYFTGRREKGLEAYAAKQGAALEALAKKSDAIVAKLSAANQFYTSELSSLSGYSSLSGLQSTIPTSGKAISAGLQAKLANLKHFSSLLTQLRAKKLGNTLLGEIIQMGPDEGSAYAQAILATPALIGQLNTLEGQIGTAETGLAQTATNVLYDSGAKAGKGFLSGLKAQQAAIDKQMDAYGKRIADAIAKAFGHEPAPKKKVVKKKAAGGPVFAGDTALVGEEGPEVVEFGDDATVHPSGAGVKIIFNGTRFPDTEQLAILRREMAYAMKM